MHTWNEEKPHFPDGLNQRKQFNISSEGVLLPNHLFPTAKQRTPPSSTYWRSSLKEHVRHMGKTDIWRVGLHHASLCCRGETAMQNRSDQTKKKKKTFKEKNSQKHGNRLRRRAARRWKKGWGDKSEQRCLAVNQLSSSLFIYLFMRWQIPS